MTFIYQKIQQFWLLLTKEQSSFATSLIKASTGSFGIQIASVALTFLTSLVLARLLQVVGFGIYTYAIAWISLLSIPATLGLNNLLIREISVYKSRSEWRLMKGILLWSNQIVFWSSGIFTILAAIIAWIAYGSSEPLTVSAIWIALIALPINSLRSMRVGAMQGLNKVVRGMLPELLISPLIMLAALSSWQLLQGDKSVLWILVIRIVAVSVSFVLGARLLYKDLPLEAKQSCPQYKMREWIKSGLPFMFLGASEIINTQGDILMLGAIKGAEVVGVYGVVSKISVLVIYIQGAVNSALGPVIASFYAENKVAKLQKLVAKSTQIVLLVSLIVSIVLTLFGKLFLSFFGSEFVVGYQPLIILTIGQFINAATGPVGLLLNMTGHEKISAISICSCAILNVILNALLIPNFGLNGAAIATSSSIIIVNIVNMFLVNQKLKISPFPFNVRNTKISK